MLSRRLETLKISVNLTHRFLESAEVVVIFGRVMSNDDSVSDSLISLQVNDPHGTSIHITLTYSNDTGHFNDEFTLETEAIPGNYTLFLTVSKIGYEDATLEIPFQLFADFDLMVSPKISELRPKEEGNFTVEAVPEFPGNISLRLLTCPNFIECKFIPDQISSGGNATLFLNISATAPSGAYNVSMAGIADGKIRTTNLTISILEIETTTLQTSISEITGVPFPFISFMLQIFNSPYFILGIIVVSILLAFTLFYKLRKRRKEVDLHYMSAARAIAKLEELKALGKIDDETYKRLKQEFEAKI
jgi:uncharacterized membrane protein